MKIKFLESGNIIDYWLVLIFGRSDPKIPKIVKTSRGQLQ